MSDVSLDHKVIVRKGENVALRLIGETDLATLLPWINDEEVSGFIIRYLPIHPTEELKWIQALPGRIGKDFVFMMEVGGVAIGTIGIHGIDTRNRTATVGIMIGEREYWSKGHGTEAMMLLLRYCFMNLNLRKISLSVLAHNPRAIRCYEKCGFEEEGRLSKEHWRNGEYVGEIRMAIFQKDWLASQQ